MNETRKLLGRIEAVENMLSALGKGRGRKSEQCIEYIGILKRKRDKLSDNLYDLIIKGDSWKL